MTKNEKFQSLIIDENNNLKNIILEKDQQIVQQDKELADFEQQALQLEQHTHEMALVLRDFEGIREENQRLRTQAKEAQDARKAVQTQLD